MRLFLLMTPWRRFNCDWGDEDTNTIIKQALRKRQHIADYYERKKNDMEAAVVAAAIKEA